MDDLLQRHSILPGRVRAWRFRIGLVSLLCWVLCVIVGRTGDSAQGQTGASLAVSINIDFAGNFVQDALAGGETLPSDTTFASVALATHASSVSHINAGRTASAGRLTSTPPAS